MAELIVIGFDDPQEADRVLSKLNQLQREYLIDLEDSVVAIRQPNGKVNLKQSVNMVGAGAASGGISGVLWGTLVGLLFLNPVAGMAIGGVIGLGTGARTEAEQQVRAESYPTDEESISTWRIYYARLEWIASFKKRLQI